MERRSEMREFIPKKPYYSGDEDIRDAWDRNIEDELGFLHYCDCCEYYTYHELEYGTLIRVQRKFLKNTCTITCCWCGLSNSAKMTKKQFIALKTEIFESKKYVKYKGHLLLDV